MSKLNVVDSSAWLEYFADSTRASNFAKAIEDTECLIVPAIVLYEVFKKVLRESGEEAALQVTAQMQSGRVIDFDSEMALDAARYKLPLADSIIYATAQKYDATLWTQDDHFESLPGVKYYAK